jgi:hypothetical protein
MPTVTISASSGERATTGLLPPTTLKVVRGEPLEIELEFETDLGSPIPALTFTLAESREASTKLYTAEVEPVDGEPTIYRILLPAEETNLDRGRYWWDVWRLDIPQLVALGSLDVQAVVRLP